jgi:hypothetical protein
MLTSGYPHEFSLKIFAGTGLHGPVETGIGRQWGGLEA